MNSIFKIATKLEVGDVVGKNLTVKFVEQGETNVFLNVYEKCENGWDKFHFYTYNNAQFVQVGDF